jgi:hypothetical protein
METVFILLPCVSAGFLVYIVYLFSFSDPAIVEFVYSRGIYPVFTRLSFLTANLPFSFAEIFAYALLTFLVFYAVLILKSLWKPNKKRLKTALFRLVVLAVICSSLLAFFIAGWSFNYARMPLAQSLGLNASPASVSELYQLCQSLSARANHLRSGAAQDSAGVFKMNKSRQEINLEVKDVFQTYAPPFMNLGAQTNVKGVLTYNLLSGLNILGIFIPFTYEPNVNMQMPDLYYGSSALHEYAHFKGFAREDEANFIAYYVSRNMPDTDFAYPSTMLALVNSMNQLAVCDPHLHSRIWESLSPAVCGDLVANATYWAQFKDSQKTVEAMNNNYLKSNNQSDGVQSYGRMVDLLIALQRAGEL